MLNIWAD